MNTVETTHKARIFIVDDHPVMRRGLSQIIDDLDDMKICGDAAEMNDALRRIEELKPDAVVIDISLGDGNGIELIKQIKAVMPDTRMLVCSMHDESLFAERAMRAGALGYVNKTDDTETFLTALRRVLDGKIHLSQRMTDRMLQQVAGGHDENINRSPIERLSDRELEVFEMIGHGLITKQIAAKLHLSPKTVETYRENIKAKLNLRNGSELTRHAVQWVLEQG
ncbi:MAG: response regulator transcription factor [Planctomycetaceae bacterium]